MMSYKKAFTLNTSEIEGRIDPLFYIAIKKIQKDIINKAKYKHIKLIKACSINRGRFGHRPRNDPQFYNGDYPFIQTGDIVKASKSNTSIEYTQTLNELGLKTSKIFNPPKLLFTIAANIGDTALLDYASCFPDSIVALIPNNDDLILEYLNIYFKLIKPYILELAPYSAQKNLNNQQLAQIPLIIPPKKIQSKIIQIMDNAYKIKQANESKAKELLNSIDSYLLEKLDITLPKEEKVVSFKVSSSDIFAGRFDPSYQISYKKLMKSHKYKEYFLNELAIINKGQSITKVNIIKGIYPVIAGGQKSPYNHNIFNYHENIITISASGAYAGYVWYHNYKIFASDCSIVNSKDINIVSNKYIFEILKLKQNEIYNLQQGSAQPHVYPKNIKSLKIPLPPLSIQNQIVEYLEALRDEAEILQKEAKEVLKNAKLEVEKIILGED